jgi:PKD repeat protein
MANGGVIVLYSWDFGDGFKLNTTGPVAAHIYTLNGNYTVTLTVVDNDNLSSYVIKIVKIREYPLAEFTFYPSPATLRGAQTIFNATLSDPRGGSIVNYTWNFADGNVTTTTIPVLTHVFQNAGIYSVILTVTDSEGLSGSRTKAVIVVVAAPVASFTWTPENPVTGQAATFNASGSYDLDGNIVLYSWYFGDGALVNTTVPAIQHTFNASGTYNVTLTVIDNEGYRGSTYRLVEVITYPTASFVWTPYPNPITPEPTVLDASSSSAGSGVIVSYAWNFGDGNMTSTTSPIVIHVFGKTGFCDVILTVQNSYGLTKSLTQRVEVFGYPEAHFTWKPALPLKGSPVAFNASYPLTKPNGGYIKNYTWNFGDGNITGNLTGPFINHTYSAVGEYVVVLAVTDSENLTDAISITVRISDSPTADFTWSPPTPYEDEIATFDASASRANSGTITAYVWSFGDGNTTMTVNPTIAHVYGSAGNYSVVLNVTNSDGFSHATTKTVSVAAAQPPLADFTYSPPSPGVYANVTFDASASAARGGTITSYIWSFGDGNVTTATAPIAYHVYQIVGSFTVTLNVTCSTGLWTTVTRQIQVAPLSGPTASFSWSPTTGVVNQTVAFNATASTPGWNGTMNPPITYYTWDFGDGNMTTTTNPLIAHAYAVEGNYTVTLTVVDINGLDNTVTQVVGVVLQKLPQDVNGDGIVNMLDLYLVALHYGEMPSNPKWDPRVDVDKNNIVNMLDLYSVALQFGEIA